MQGIPTSYLQMLTHLSDSPMFFSGFSSVMLVISPKQTPPTRAFFTGSIPIKRVLSSDLQQTQLALFSSSSQSPPPSHTHPTRKSHLPPVPVPTPARPLARSSPPPLVGSFVPETEVRMGDEPVNVKEYQQLAKQALPKMYYDYFAGGAEDQHTLRENIDAFQRIIIRPRILVDVSKIDMSTTILGYKTSAPIMIAPTAMHKLAHPGGEILTAKAAAACNVIMGLSFMSTCTIEEVASSCNAVRFFQLDVYKRREISALMVKRAEINGFKAILLTADTPKPGRREADIKNKMIAPQLKNFEGLISTEVHDSEGSNLEAFAAGILDPSFSWKDIAWLKSITNLPILIKGVLTREDAIKAVEVGVEGIIVSNHGARQLDFVPATIAVLEEVVGAVQGRIPVLFDGGIRRGTDVFKALALGAHAVMVGRPVVYGLAAKGEYGVRRVVEMLKDELELTMALSGCPTLNDITRNHVKTPIDRHHCRL